MSQSLFAKTSLGGGFKPLTRTTPKLDGTSSTYTERVQALDVAAAKTPADKINRTRALPLQSALTSMMSLE